MADFDPPFAWDGERRVPTADEIQSGIGCGPFSLPMWNWLFWSLWSELGEVITHAGLTPDNGDMTQVRQAIQAMIDASTGGGDTESYLTLLQASVRLPIFPEVQNDNGHFGVITPAAGQVRVPAGVSFLHRGISPYATVQTDLATDASKTYHLRWNKTDGFTLKDLASSGYNPGTLAESDASFDSTYDDMLVARVVTNSSNVPTITNLVNRSRLRHLSTSTGTASKVTSSEANDTIRYDAVFTLNWGRTPHPVMTGYTQLSAGVVQIEGFANKMTVTSMNRYSVSGRVETDHRNTLPATAVSGGITLSAID